LPVSYRVQVFHITRKKEFVCRQWALQAIEDKQARYRNGSLQCFRLDMCVIENANLKLAFTG
jgi:hypothetical protein